MLNVVLPDTRAYVFCETREECELLYEALKSAGYSWCEDHTIDELRENRRKADKHSYQGFDLHPDIPKVYHTWGYDEGQVRIDAAAAHADFFYFRELVSGVSSAQISDTDILSLFGGGFDV